LTFEYKQKTIQSLVVKINDWIQNINDEEMYYETLSRIYEESEKQD